MVLSLLDESREFLGRQRPVLDEMPRLDGRRAVPEYPGIGSDSGVASVAPA